MGRFDVAMAALERDLREFSLRGTFDKARHPRDRRQRFRASGERNPDIRAAAGHLVTMRHLAPEHRRAYLSELEKEPKSVQAYVMTAAHEEGLFGRLNKQRRR